MSRQNPPKERDRHQQQLEHTLATEGGKQVDIAKFARQGALLRKLGLALLVFLVISFLATGHWLGSHSVVVRWYLGGGLVTLTFLAVLKYAKNVAER